MRMSPTLDTTDLDRKLVHGEKLQTVSDLHLLGHNAYAPAKLTSTDLGSLNYETELRIITSQVPPEIHEGREVSSRVLI